MCAHYNWKWHLSAVLRTKHSCLTFWEHCVTFRKQYLTFSEHCLTFQDHCLTFWEHYLTFSEHCLTFWDQGLAFLECCLMGSTEVFFTAIMVVYVTQQLFILWYYPAMLSNLWNMSEHSSSQYKTCNSSFTFTCIECKCFPRGKMMLPGVFLLQQLWKYIISTCIACKHYTIRKTIFWEVFWLQQLPKYSITGMECSDYAKGKAILSQIFKHQKLLKNSILMCIECAYHSEGKTIFSEIFWCQQLPKYSIFMCIECAYYSGGKTIFSEIFRHQLLLKDFTFTGIQCTCSWSHKQHSLKYFGTDSCRNIPFSCAFSVHVTLKANNVLRNISTPTAAEILHFHVY